MNISLNLLGYYKVYCSRYDFYFSQSYSVEGAVDDPEKFCCPNSRVEDDEVACGVERKLLPCEVWFCWEKEILRKS